MISLTDLFACDVEEVLTTPLLRQAAVSYTRSLFYGGSPISSCDSSVRLYFRRLQLEGLEQEKKLSNMKYQLKPGTVIVFSNQAYNASTITDAIAEDYLSKFPKAIGNFIVKEDEVKEAKQVTSKAKPKAKK
jgi:hypothetical protein